MSGAETGFRSRNEADQHRHTRLVNREQPEGRDTKLSPGAANASPSRYSFLLGPPGRGSGISARIIGCICGRKARVWRSKR